VTLEKAYYESCFERDYATKKATEFQDFFAEIMEKRYPADFVRIRPWGSSGDRKNDGYLRSKRMLFQVYAPNEMTAAQAIAKIDEDFRVALPHWRSYFDTWVFVHNSRQGLAPQILKKLRDLRSEFLGQVNLIHWGFEELKSEVFSLDIDGMSSLFGLALTDRDIQEIGFEDIRVLLARIGGTETSMDIDVRPVPGEKLSFNALGPDVETLLRAGMRKSANVEKFLAQWHDPGLGDRMAKTFENQYRSLRDTGMSPDDVFRGLQEFAGGRKRGTPRHEAAVLAVLAYLFERCDIFERPQVGG